MSQSLELSRASKGIASTILTLLLALSPLLFGLWFANFIGMPFHYQGIVAAVGVALFVAILARLLARYRYHLGVRKLVIRGALLSKSIPYDAITEVSKIRRVSQGKSRERVRIAYDDAGSPRAFEIAPHNAMEFITELIARCPHLSEFMRTRLVRNDAFRQALAGGDDDGDRPADD